MNRQQISQAWHRFWFEPTSPAPVCVYRILVGLIALANGLLYSPDVLFWFGPHGALSMNTWHAIDDSTNINLFVWFGHSDIAVLCLFWVYMLAALFLTIGLCTRLSTVVAWMLTVSFHARNPFMWHSVDVLLRVVLFTLIFAPAGARLSVDSLLRRRFSRDKPQELYCPWAQRLLQILQACIYFRGFWGKLGGATWWQGSAVYFATQSNWGRLGLPPFLDNPACYCLMTWSALLLEFALWCLVWKRSLRYWILAAGVVFHTAIEFFLQVDLIQVLVMAGYVNFLYAEDLDRLLASFRQWSLQLIRSTKAAA
jgi:hypothetical protein